MNIPILNLSKAHLISSQSFPIYMIDEWIHQSKNSGKKYISKHKTLYVFFSKDNYCQFKINTTNYSKGVEFKFSRRNDFNNKVYDGLLNPSSESKAISYHQFYEELTYILIQYNNSIKGINKNQVEFYLKQYEMTILTSINLCYTNNIYLEIREDNYYPSINLFFKDSYHTLDFFTEDSFKNTIKKMSYDEFKERIDKNIAKIFPFEQMRPKKVKK